MVRNFPSDPPTRIRQFGYSLIEAGIRPAVKALVEAGAVTVWSCEGHRGPQAWSPSLGWFPRYLWQGYVRGRPFVICAGPRYSANTRRGALWAAMLLIDRGFGPLRLIYLHAPSRSPIRNRVRWCRTSSYFAILFSDKAACRPLHCGGHVPRRKRKVNR